MSPNENPDPVSLILFEVVDQLAADLGPQDRRYPPDFWHLAWKPEVSGILELGNVWVFVQLIHRPMRTKNQLYKNSNIA